MPTTDEELAELQETVSSKRQALAEARLDRESRERSLANDITAAQLKAEEAKLDALLAAELESGKPENVDAGVAALLDPVAAQAEAEAQHQAAVEAAAETAAANEAAAAEAATTETGEEV